MSENQGKQPPPVWAKSLALFSAILSELIGFTGAGVGIGYWAWSRWGAPWWVLLVSSLVGLGLAFYRVYILSEKLEKNDGSSDSK